MLLLNAGVFVANFALGGNNLLAMGAKVAQDDSSLGCCGGGKFSCYG